MSVQAMSWVIDYSQHKGSTFVVLLMIANHAKSDGTDAWPSVACLAKESRISESQTHRCIRKLRRSGELAVDVSAGPNGTNLYRLPKAQQFALVGTPAKMPPPAKSVQSFEMTPEPSLREEKSIREENHPSACALPVWLPRQEWDEFLEMRKKIRAPLTEAAKARTLNDLWALSQAGQDVGAVLAQSVQRSWRGVFEVKNGNGQTGPQTFAEVRAGRTSTAIRRMERHAETVVDDLQRALPETTQ